MDSAESRWILRGSEEEEEDLLEDEEEEEEDLGEQRLIRTGPRVDSFDVEAFDLPGAHRNAYEVVDLSLFLYQMEPRDFSLLSEHRELIKSSFKLNFASLAPSFGIFLSLLDELP